MSMITKEQAKENFLDHVHMLAQYWSRDDLPAKNVRDRCDGLAFSILGLLDGVSAGFPAVDLVLRPHPDDKQDCIENEADWYDDGMVFNDDCYLHDLYYKKQEMGGAE